MLELAALVSLGVWGYRSAPGITGIGLAVCIPLLAACVWGVFAVPGDPSRSGHAPIPVPGLMRLTIELAVFGLASWGLSRAGETRLALVLAVATLVHYAASYDRIRWLLRS